MPEVYTIISIIVAGIALIFTGYTLRENIITRKTSVRPLLFPVKRTDFSNDDNLFSCNCEYPLTDDVPGEPKLFYFGIKNIGKGPANNVKVLTFQSEEKDPEIFRVGFNIVRIPDGGTIPFVIRAARADDTEYNFLTFSTTIYYEDIFGNRFYISLRLWIHDSLVTVIEYNDSKNPKWRSFNNVVWREVESHGFFEMRKLEEKS